MSASIKNSGIFGFGRSGVSVQSADLVLDLNKIKEPLVIVPAVNLDEEYNERGHCLVTYSRYSFANPFKENKDDGRSSYLYFPDLQDPETNYGELIAGEEVRSSFRFLMPAFVVIGGKLQARVLSGGRPAFNQLDAADQNMKGKRLTYRDKNNKKRVAKRKGFKGVTFTIVKAGKAPKYSFTIMREDELYKFETRQIANAFEGERLNSSEAIFDYLIRNGVPASLLNGETEDVNIDDMEVIRAIEEPDELEIEDDGNEYHEDFEEDFEEEIEVDELEEDEEFDDEIIEDDDEEFQGIPF